MKSKPYCSDYGFFVTELVILPTVAGKTIVMYRNYSFSYQNNKRNIYCSRHLRGGCPARARLDNLGNIYFAITEHNHPPPVYEYCDGIYRLKKCK